ncbi:nucleoid protein H-NS [Comamonas sp. BIGb0124]|uniref:H-NS histone family protein n=1 Tax=Comamonas sp. BIGb0124 TaxID=2485130 RepID=UPI000FB8E8ED|nr:H-NS histone family protein [Comamonas sp. BIGb0124]ROR18093.1 nucleoid protein H-NS [Comamonas sp. BIGb0124]
MATYAELKAQAEALLKQADELLVNERESAIAEINQRLEQLGLTPDDLKGGKRVKAKADGDKPKRIVPVKYKGPNGETWTGRGQKPVWLAELLKQGRKVEEFLI